MRRRFIRFVALIALAAALTASLGSCNKNESNSASNTEGADTTVPEKKISLLTVSEKGKTVDGEGNNISLRGVNLGGWLIQETWMCAVSGSECNSESFEVLRNRGFTEEQIKTLFMTYADNYVKEKDIKYLASLGVNCVRLPFWYRNFMDGDLNFYSDNDSDNPGFQLTDRLVSWAGKYGIYVILDMHGCPGGQSTDHCCGIIGRNELYTDEKNLDAMQRLWERIASHYKDEPVIAAYDIMNEPMNNSTEYKNGWAAGSPEAVSKTVAVYDRMIKAIRKIDEKHIITIEGIWDTSMLPDPAKYGWTNMMYQLHLYDKTLDMVTYRVNELREVRKKYGVAVYVGEFNNGDENQAAAYYQYSRYDIAFTMWNFKVSKNNLGNWGLLSSGVESADLKNDTFDTIKRKWGTVLDSKFFNVNKTVEDFIKKYVSE